jgi:hypothetical protein
MGRIRYIILILNKREEPFVIFAADGDFKLH